jgi:hypothetical protein
MSVVVEYIGSIIYDNYDVFMDCNDGAVRRVAESDNKIRRLVESKYPDCDDRQITSFYMATLIYLFMLCKNKY